MSGGFIANGLLQKQPNIVDRYPMIEVIFSQTDASFAGVRLPIFFRILDSAIVKRYVGRTKLSARRDPFSISAASSGIMFGSSASRVEIIHIT